jgi:hypothetical protein
MQSNLPFLLGVQIAKRTLSFQLSIRHLNVK